MSSSVDEDDDDCVYQGKKEPPPAPSPLPPGESLVDQLVERVKRLGSLTSDDAALILLMVGVRDTDAAVEFAEELIYCRRIEKRRKRRYSELVKQNAISLDSDDNVEPSVREKEPESLSRGGGSVSSSGSGSLSELEEDDDGSEDDDEDDDVALGDNCDDEAPALDAWTQFGLWCVMIKDFDVRAASATDVARKWADTHFQYRKYPRHKKKEKILFQWSKVVKLLSPFGTYAQSRRRELGGDATYQNVVDYIADAVEKSMRHASMKPGMSPLPVDKKFLFIEPADDRPTGDGDGSKTGAGSSQDDGSDGGDSQSEAVDAAEFDKVRVDSDNEQVENNVVHDREKNGGKSKAKKPATTTVSSTTSAAATPVTSTTTSSSVANVQEQVSNDESDESNEDGMRSFGELLAEADDEAAAAFAASSRATISVSDDSDGNPIEVEDDDSLFVGFHMYPLILNEGVEKPEDLTQLGLELDQDKGRTVLVKSVETGELLGRMEFSAVTGLPSLSRVMDRNLLQPEEALVDYETQHKPPFGLDRDSYVPVRILFSINQETANKEISLTREERDKISGKDRAGSNMPSTWYLLKNLTKSCFCCRARDDETKPFNELIDLEKVGYAVEETINSLDDDEDMDDSDDHDAGDSRRRRRALKRKALAPRGMQTLSPKALESMFSAGTELAEYYPKARALSKDVNLYKYQAQALWWMLRREGAKFPEVRTGGLLDLDMGYTVHNHLHAVPSSGGKNVDVWANQETGCILLHRPSTHPRAVGGILADEMGLGKTVMMISLICTHRPPRPYAKLAEKEEKQSRETLKRELAIANKKSHETYNRSKQAIRRYESLRQQQLQGTYVHPSKLEKAMKEAYRRKQTAKKTSEIAVQLDAEFSAACDALNEERRCGTLVVCPMSVLRQWQTMLKKFAPGLNIRQYHGTGRRSGMFLEDLKEADVVLTTYNTLAADLFSDRDHATAEAERKKKRREAAAAAAAASAASAKKARSLAANMTQTGGISVNPMMAEALGVSLSPTVSGGGSSASVVDINSSDDDGDDEDDLADFESDDNDDFGVDLDDDEEPMPKSRRRRGRKPQQATTNAAGGKKKSVPLSESELKRRVAKGHSPLHTVKWWRVILDEAHEIRRSTTNMARSVYKLNAVNKWALTGTPIQNQIDDLHSLLRFVGAAPFHHMNWWRQYIQKPYADQQPESLRRLQRVLRPIVLRRTKNDVKQLALNQERDDAAVAAAAAIQSGNPVAVTTVGNGDRGVAGLPARYVNNVYLKLTGAEKEVYDFFAIWASGKAKKFKGQGIQTYSRVFQLVLRMRQACVHPFLTLPFWQHYRRVGQSARLKRHQQQQSLSSTTQVESGDEPSISMEACVRASLLAEKFPPRDSSVEVKSRSTATTSFPATTTTTTTTATSENGTNQFVCLACCIRNQDGTSSKSSAVSTTSVSALTTISECGHCFCHTCLIQYFEELCDEDSRHLQSRRGTLSGICPLCDTKVTQPQLQPAPAGAKPSLDLSLLQLNTMQTKDEIMDTLRVRLFESAKMRALLRRLKLAAKYNESTVVFSQWTSMLALIQETLRQHGIAFLTYDGSMNPAQRQEAVDRFQHASRGSVDKKKVDQSLVEFQQDRVRRVGRRRQARLNAELRRQAELMDGSDTDAAEPVESDSDVPKLARLQEAVDATDFDVEVSCDESDAEDEIGDGDGDHQQDQWKQSLQHSERPRVLLVSLRAGGLGLDLSCANRVVIMDPWWNPSTEAQAIDRVHRLGQKRPVFVDRLLVQDSVEEWLLLKLQSKKRTLASNMLDLSKTESTRITMHDLLSVLKKA